MGSVSRLHPMVPTAYLRIFQPLETFEASEQEHWERYIVARTRSPLIRPRYRDHPNADGLGVLTPADGEHAEIKLIDGRTYVSPWRTKLRVLAATVAFHDAQSFELAHAFVSKRDARRAARELGKIRRHDPGAVSFCHESPWHVPIRWFVFFDEPDRRLAEDEFGRLRLRYQTTVRTAIRRAEHAVPVLRKTDLGPISDLIVDLHQWLSSFDHLSLLELDYGGLCESMTWDELDDDHSAQEIQRALEAIASYDYARSTEIYQAVLGHWAEVRSREILN